MKRPDKLHRFAIEAVAARGEMLDGPRMKALRAGLEEAFPGAIERARDRRKRAAFDSKFAGPVPEWAKRYVKKHSPNIDRLTIRQSRTKPYSSGHCLNGGEIVVTFGAGRETDADTLVERQAVVLHELAHSLKPWHGHDETFYAEWRRLLVAEGILRAAIATGRFRAPRKLRRAAIRS